MRSSSSSMSVFRALSSTCLLAIFYHLHGCISQASAQTSLPGSWELLVQNAGVSAMHMTLTPANTVIMYDRTDYGPSQLKLAGGACRKDPQDLALQVDCYAHSIELDLSSNSVRPLEVLTDTWCSSGAFLADGTLVSTGGWNDGTQVVRFFGPCNAGGCDWIESSNRLSSARWYASDQILPDNQIIVVGGRRAFSYEFAPKTSAAVELPFLSQTSEPNAENNLYPFLHLSSDGNLFIFANSRSILLNYKTNQVVKTFPELLGGSRNYPSSGSSAMLPLSAADNFQTVEVMICGGAPHGAFQKVAANTFQAALQTCGRMVITDSNPSWAIETMPSTRILSDMIVLPTGEILIINGAKQGTAGWNSARDPALSPFLYSPSAAPGSRFQELTASPVPRMYHSSAVLLPDGRILVGGSNPNQGYVFTNVPFPTELRIEAYNPYYLDTSFDSQRPTITAIDSQIGYGASFQVEFSVPDTPASVEFRLYAPSFSTHTTAMNQRQLILQPTSLTATATGYLATVVAPPSPIAAPAGYYLLFVVNGGSVPGVAAWIRLS